MAAGVRNVEVLSAAKLKAGASWVAFTINAPMPDLINLLPPLLFVAGNLSFSPRRCPYIGEYGCCQISGLATHYIRQVADFGCWNGQKSAPSGEDITDFNPRAPSPSRKQPIKTFRLGDVLTWPLVRGPNPATHRYNDITIKRM